MKYLLDVNALIAFRHARAPAHAVFHAWAGRVGLETLHTCAMAELGFMRVSMQTFGYDARQAQQALAEMKKGLGDFVGAAPSPSLPEWADTAAKTSDAYLAQVAKAAGMVLATFDAGIPGAEVIR